MNAITHQLKNDLQETLNFWLKNIVGKGTAILPDFSCINEPNAEAELGSMFLSRIVYGASAACKLLGTDAYKAMADTSVDKLLQDFKNPQGGYYWALNAAGKPMHDFDNVNMAQAFVLYGLAEYYSVFSEEKVKVAIEEQVSFLLNTIYDKENGGFFDGFDANWNIAEKKTRFFGTHIHLLEAFTKLYECNASFIDKKYIEELILLIQEKYIDTDNHRIHQLDFNWQAMPNTVWAGHDAECSWILCYCAKAVKNQVLIETTEALALKMMEKVLENALDSESGGVYNAMLADKPAEKEKSWWPQAEAVLGCVNCYEITKDEKYLQTAFELIDYIKRVFYIEGQGEWYAALSDNGTPDLSIPKVNFWKSLYHNVRYYVDTIRRLEEIK